MLCRSREENEEAEVGVATLAERSLRRDLELLDVEEDDERDVEEADREEADPERE